MADRRRISMENRCEIMALNRTMKAKWKVLRLPDEERTP
jgi:hypothetical protein